MSNVSNNKRKKQREINGAASRASVAPKKKGTDHRQSTAATEESTTRIWKNLVDWVHQAGGVVHPALHLTGHGPTRGITATAPIQKGSLLIRVPPACVISGLHVPSKVNAETPASPWLRCLGALLQAQKEASLSLLSTGSSTSTSTPTTPATAPTLSNHITEAAAAPYITSLPSRGDYETLFQWSTEDIRQFLAGTTLGKLLLLDRNERTLEKRYRLGVEPFLELLGGVQLQQHNQRVHNHKRRKQRSASDEERELELDDLEASPSYQSFLEASMCISTRGFRLTNEEEDDDENGNSNPKTDSAWVSQPAYNGPFLLPVIDLLNHDPDRTCTTLQRDSGTGNFTMVAERSLKAGEDVVHSYGNDLTSAQLLQTFGFVPTTHTQQLLSSTANMTSTSSSMNFLTPLSLHKIDHVLRSCLIVKNSIYPRQIQGIMMQSRDTLGGRYIESNEDDEYWDVEDIPDRQMAASMPDEFLISLTSKETQKESSLLSEDLLTFLCVQFLPEDVFVEIFRDETSTTRLDRSVLENDPYLGMFVCYTLLMACSIRRDEYTASPSMSGNGKESERKLATGDLITVVVQEVDATRKSDEFRLSTLVSKNPRTPSEDRDMFGRTIRVEELTNMAALTEEVTSLLNTLRHR